MKGFAWLAAVMISVSLICGCSSEPKQRQAPSAAPVRKALSTAQRSINDAQGNAALAHSSVAAAVSAADHGNIDQVKVSLAQANSAIDSLTKSLLTTQRSLIDSQEHVDELEAAARKQTEALNKSEIQKHKSGFSWLTLASTVLSFVSNPFSFIVTRAVEFIVGVALAFILFLLALHFFRRWRNGHWTK